MICFRGEFDIKLLLPHNGLVCIIVSILAAILAGVSGTWGLSDPSQNIPSDVAWLWICSSVLSVSSAFSICVSKSMHLSMPILAIALVLFTYPWISETNAPFEIQLLIAAVGMFCFAFYSFLVFGEYRTFKYSPKSDADLTIQLCNEETVLRKYRCVELDFSPRIAKAPKSTFSSSKFATSGYLVITNRRVMYIVDTHAFHSIATRSNELLSQQVRIEDVSGIDSTTSFSRQSYVYAFATMAIGAISCFTLVGIIALPVGAIWCYLIHKNVETSMIFGIRSKSTQYGMFVSESSRGYGDTFQYWCCPTEEFEIMTQEVGAIVLDLQKYGDEAIGKWRIASENTFNLSKVNEND